MSDQAVLAGYVTSIVGSKVLATLVTAESSGSPMDAAQVDLAVQIGALVRIDTPRSSAFGVVNRLDAQQASSPPRPDQERLVEIDLFGETPWDGQDDTVLDFRRGISVFPTLGAPLYSTTDAELSKIYARPDASNVVIGSLYQDSRIPAYVMTNELLGKHFAILGTTGSGKSCALSVVLHSVLEAHPHGHIVLLDPHNEYWPAFGEEAEIIRPADLQLPYWLLNFEEMIEVLCSPDTNARDSESAILKDAILHAKRAFVSNEEDSRTLTVDTPVPYRLSALIERIDEAMGDLGKPDQMAPYLRLKLRINDLRDDRRFGFMFAGLTVKDNMTDVLSRILRIPTSGRAVSIFDLSGVPSEIVDVVVSLLCRTIFDFALWSPPEDSAPILMICEEAHRYIPRDPQDGFGPTRKAIARIAKEGRKYGVSLGLVTQRPSELAETILSQCNTLFALRMGNQQDQDFVERALPESAAGMLSCLPSLRTQEAVVVGEGVRVPIRIRFSDLEERKRPQSDTANFAQSWLEDSTSRDTIERSIDRWRRQQR
ncbi:ATP-binding protein [Pelagibius sp. Alg239-R121]|uniref:ATP-binding protein n=1 Tax=Pelagibius sp. Alg239-R121 TaxID=2993448 RepID=UPI0024A6C475|nr:DUF87 domain-containing protein [Pelagibius sp. Alg239-R121]